MKTDQELPTYFLKPGEICFTQEPALIRTVLGSCVTVTMLCRRLGIAAACHPVLPLCREGSSCRPGNCRQKNKYVECVIPGMISLFQKRNVLLGELEVKLFGGANMFSRNGKQREILHVGNMNVSMARQKISELELVIKSYDVGGNRGRKLLFDTRTGDVWVKKFQENNATRDELTVVQSQLTMQLKDYEK
jgi:chemotaxis protein CheD